MLLIRRRAARDRPRRGDPVRSASAGSSRRLKCVWAVFIDMEPRGAGSRLVATRRNRQPHLL